MEITDHIRGENRAKLLTQLQEERTVLRMLILGRGYERLTMVIGLKKEGNPPAFRIDEPEDFAQNAGGTGKWQMHFDFTSADGIPYQFRTTGGKISGTEIWIPFPDAIERRQRRGEFRLEAPAGTVANFRIHSKKQESAVINISLGGALLSVEKDLKTDSPVELGQTLKGLNFSFPLEGGITRVQIREAVVKRLGKEPSTRKYHCALQFTFLEKEEKMVLNQLIYRFQREFLRKMKYMEN